MMPQISLVFQGDNKRHSRVSRPHPQQENKKKHPRCPKSSSYASQRDLSDKEIQQKSIKVSTQRKDHDRDKALSIYV